MTSRRVYKWKFVKNEKGEWARTARLRPVLRGPVDLEAFDVETFSGAARRLGQGLLASAAARKKQLIITSLGIDGFLGGLDLHRASRRDWGEGAHGAFCVATRLSHRAEAPARL